MITNTHKLHSMIRLATESAREEINEIDLNHLEEILPDELFKPLFDAICTIDETQKMMGQKRMYHTKIRLPEKSLKPSSRRCVLSSDYAGLQKIALF